MPFSYCWTTRIDRPAAISPATTRIMSTTIRAATWNRLLLQPQGLSLSLAPGIRHRRQEGRALTAHGPLSIGRAGAPSRRGRPAGASRAPPVDDFTGPRAGDWPGRAGTGTIRSPRG